MKKIFIILSLLIVSVVGLSQTYPISNRANSSYTVQDARFSALYNLFVPKYSDTTAANLQLGNDSLSAVIYTYSTQSLWVRTIASGSIKKWLEIGSGGGGGGTWGSITGTLSNQTDLQTALNLKANLASPTFTGTVTFPTPFTLGATSVTATGVEANYLIGVTSAIQPQINGRVEEAKVGADFVVSNDSLKIADAVNIEDFGAIGDGVTNNSTFIQNAINTGKPVYVPPGIFRVDAIVSLRPNQTLFGKDWTSIIKIVANTSAIRIDSGSRVTSLSFIGNGKAGSGIFNSGIFLNEAVGWSVDNCKFQDFAGDPVLNGGGGIFGSTIHSIASEGGRISNCYFFNNDCGLNLATRAEYVTVTGCTFSANTVALLAAAGNLTVTGNIIEGNTTGIKSILATNGAHSTFTNNLVNHNTYLLWLEDATHTLGMTFSNNMFYSGAIKIIRSSNIKFTGCHFSALDSVHLDAATFMSRVNCWFDNAVAINKYNGAESFSVVGEIRYAAATPSVWMNQVDADTLRWVGPEYHTGTVNIGTAGSSTGVFTQSGATSGTITFQPASAAGTYTVTWPTNDGGASQVLTTNGSGVLSWENPAGNVSNTGTPLDNQLAVWTNATTIEGDPDLIFNGTQLGIQGTPGFALDIWNGNTPTILMGADASASTRTNSTLKVGTIGFVPYTNSEEPFGIRSISTSSSHGLYYGIGTTGLNGATDQSFYTTTYNNTTAIRKLLITNTVFHINDAQSNFDTRIDGNGAVNVFFVDGNGASGTGGVAIYGNAPTAYLHIGAGTTAASTAPLKFTSGSLQTTAEAGAVEFLTDKFYGTITTGAARKEFTLNNVALTSGRIPFVTTNGRLTDVSGVEWNGTTAIFPLVKITAGSPGAGKVLTSDADGDGTWTTGLSSGASTQSGNGATTVFNIAHGLGITPTVKGASSNSADATALFTVTADGTNIIITYTTPPASGSSNLTWSWYAK